MDESQTVRATIEEAAQLLGIKEESVRKRVSRGKLRADKDPDGRLLVYVDSTETVRDEYTDTPTDRDLLCQELRSRISSLEYQLSEERESRRRADTIIAQLGQANATLAARVPALEQPPEAPESATEPLDRGGVPQERERPAEAPRERSWWRRIFGP